MSQSAARDSRVARFTVDQVHAMVRAGILEESASIELIDGVLVYKDRSASGEDPMTIGRRHNLGVKLLGRLDAALGKLGYHMQTQGPVTLPPYDEPEPDGAVVRGDPRDYVDRLPAASDVPVVFEVADSSLTYDRTTKLALYARATIPQYVIVNLRDGCIELYERPEPGPATYGATSIHRPGDTLVLRVASDQTLEIDVTEILP